MAATPEELARIQNLETQFAAFLAGTLAPDALSGTQRHALIDSLYPIINGYRNKKASGNNDFTAWESGDEVQHIDGVGKVLTIGQVTNTPFNPTTDLSDNTKFDRYVNNQVF
ncbi:hypothetical protein [Flagellimonas flava]|uniref:hypothetical protein n=1 Tax=Flagellimonas flava TaxID=570519 RepID=UPI003D649AE6